VSPQLRSAEEASQKKRGAAGEGKLQEIDKEIKEQETLIKGYQQVCPPDLFTVHSSGVHPLDRHLIKSLFLTYP